MANNWDLSIVGLGMVTGPQPGKTTRLLETEAARLAIEDAGLKQSDIDGAVQYHFSGGAGEDRASSDAFPRLLGLPVKFYEERVGRGGSKAAPAIMFAAKFLEMGMAKYVVVSGATTGLSRHRERRESGGRGGTTQNLRQGYWGRPFGDSTAVCHHSFLAARHMHEFGTRSDHLGRISVAQRDWACLNPDARYYGRPITLEDHQNSEVLVWPYHLFDICVINDGAVSFVLTTRERAEETAKRPVHILGVGYGEAMEELWWEKQNYTRLAVKTAKEQAFGQAGIEIKDVDTCQFYDCFTSEVLFQIEDYGFCGKGEGGPFLEEGHLGPEGDVAINTGGGLLSAYHYGDLTGLSEAVTQLRGEAGDRQVKDAEISLFTGHGGEIISPGMCSIHSCVVLGRG